MNQPSDTALELAAILGEAIARVHLAGKIGLKITAPVPESLKGEATEHAADVSGANNG